MAIKNIEFIQIEAALDSLGRKQIGVEPDVDSELNFRMWGGKDSTGALTHWLAKNKPGVLHSLRLSSLAGQSQSIAKIDANGNIIRGSSDNTTSSQIKDNERDDITDPVRPDNITDIEQLTFVRNLGANANYTVVASEERTYGVLIPPPSMEAGVGKVPIYKDGNQIEWGTLDDGETIEHVLDLADLDAENTTFNVDLIPNRNHAISFTGSSEEIPIVAIEINENQPYNIQIIGACNLSLTGVEWWSDAVTDVTSKAEVNVMNGRAIGVTIDV